MSGPIATAITEKLTAAFQPVALQVTDQSHLHAGHAGHDGRGESHFKVTLIAPAFEGMSRIDRQRQVHAALADELADRVHALALTLRTPEEAAKLAR